MAAVEQKRKTRETEVRVTLNLYGKGESDVQTGIGFFDHMLELFAFHGRFDLQVQCKGDLHVDGHHTVEDVGIVLGQAMKQAIPSEKRLTRYASCLLPMDESLARAVVDISGRPYLVFEAGFRKARVGDFETELVKEFFYALVQRAGITMHLRLEYGVNTHHQIEALFKCAAVALRLAVRPDESGAGPASTKGVI